MEQARRRMFRNDVSAETRAKQSVAHQGRKHSNDTKNKISKSLQIYWANLPMKPTTNNTSAIDRIYGKKD